MVMPKLPQFDCNFVNLLRTGLVDISTTSVSYYFGIVSGVILYVIFKVTDVS